MDDHETRLLRELPERVDREKWLLQFRAVLGSETAAIRLFDRAEEMRRSSGGNINDHCTALHYAAVMGWITD